MSTVCGGLPCPFWVSTLCVWVPECKDWLPNFGSFRTSTYKDWASNLGRFGRPLWSGVDSQRGQAWATIVDKVGRPPWRDIGFQVGQMWVSKVGRLGCPDASITGRPLPPKWGALIVRPLWVLIVGLSFCGGMCTPNNWAPTPSQTLGVHVCPLWTRFLGVLFGRMWVHSNGTPTLPVHAASKWPHSSLFV